MLNKNEIITLEIVDVNSEGCGVGRHDGMVVFVPFTIPGEVVTCRVEKVGKSFCHARVTEIVTPSQQRIIPDCPSYYRCGGCAFRHIVYDGEIDIKKNIVDAAFSRLGGIDFPCEKIFSSPSKERYRNKAQFVIRRVDNVTKTGFYAPRSHRFIPIDDCMLQPKTFTKIAEVCCRYFDDNNIPCYSEEDNSGYIRHLLLRQSEATGELMVCVVSRKYIDLTKLSEMLSGEVSHSITVLLNVNSERTNVILGKNNELISGRGVITEHLHGVKYNISPHSFFQINTPGAEQLYNIVREFAEPKKSEKVLDLYCGVGSIGLSICDKNQPLLGVDIVKQAIDAAKENAKNAGFTAAKFMVGDAHTGLLGEYKPDIVILDPPRKGLDEKTIQLLLENLPKKIVMVSCNPSTAARDVAKLLPKYQIKRLAAMDMFARCAHVECVVKLCRVDAE